MRNDRAGPLDVFSAAVAAGLNGAGTWLFLGALGDPSSVRVLLLSVIAHRVCTTARNPEA